MIRWRYYRPEDEAGLRARHTEQCAATGLDFAFPDLDDPRYFATYVAEQDGAVVGAVTVHATTEILFLGANAGVMRAAVGASAAIQRDLQARGCDEAHAFVPNRVAGKMEPILRRMGFRRSNPHYTVFYREL